MNNTSSQTALSTTSYNELQKLLQRVAQGNLDAVEKYLSSAQFEEKELNQAIFLCISNFSTLRNHTECLFALLRQKKANPNCIINDRTPLMAACTSGQQSLVRCLLENGAKVDVRDSNFNHPLFYIMNIDSENFDAAELIIERMPTANIEISRKLPALVFAIQKQHERIAKKLIEKGANLGFLSDQGDTIMHIVCRKQFAKVAKQKRLIRLLVNKVNNPHCKNKQNKTPLDYLTNEELRQMILESSKPKIKEKQKQKKKDDIFDLQEEEMAEQFADDFDEYSNRKDSKDDQTDKKFDSIQEESDEDKKEESERDKEKGIVKPRKSINSNVHITQKIKQISKQPKTPIVVRAPLIKQKDKDKPSSKFEKKVSNRTIKSTTIKTEPSIQIIKEQNRQKQRERQKEKSRDRQKHRERERQKEFALAELQLKEMMNKNKLKMEKVDKLEVDLQVLKQKNQPDPNEAFYKHSSRHWMLTKDQLSQILTREINEFVQAQTKNCQDFFQINLQIIQIVQALFTEKFPDIKPLIYQYGSQSSGLCLDFSDTDLVIVSRSQPFELFGLIEDARLFEKTELFKEAKFIKNASIPIIKLQMSVKYLSRKVDITFQTAFHNGLRCSSLLREFMDEQPLIRPITLVLKKFLYSRNLNDTYTGGLGSYSIALMVVALLQSTIIDKKHPHSVGRLLLEFFFFYGYQMDYICKSILLYSPKFKDLPTYNVFPLPNTQDTTPKLIIHDPLNPVNNVGRSTYKIFQIKMLFMESYNKLFYNFRCADRNCRWKRAMSEQSLAIRPCCLLSRLFL